jgi:hypothetical protein
MLVNIKEEYEEVNEETNKLFDVFEKFNILYVHGNGNIIKAKKKKKKIKKKKGKRKIRKEKENIKKKLK